VTDYDKIRGTKERAEAKLRTLPGVHAVGIGEKYVAGKTTHELSILVLVVKKKALGELRAEEVVPTEIEGIKTDVIEVPMPRRMSAPNPANLRGTIVNNLSITFSGQNKPGAFLLVTVDFTGTPTGVVPPYFSVPCETFDSDTLVSIAGRIANQITAHSGLTGGQKATNNNSATVTVTPPPNGGTFTFTSVTVTAIDNAQYFDQWVRGGIQLALEPNDVNGSGTLGCVATNAGTSAQSQPTQVYALTNYHVVEPLGRNPTNLTVATSAPGGVTTFTLGSSNGQAILPNSELAFVFNQPSPWNPGGLPPAQEALYVTVQGDTPTSIATNAAAVAKKLAIPGVTVGNSGTTITVTGAPVSCEASYPVLSASGLSVSVNTTTATFNNSADSDNYGVFLNINPGGPAASFGIYVNPAKGTSASEVAKAVANAFAPPFPASLLGSVTVTQTNNTVSVSNAEEIECHISNDMRVGQPDPSFGSACSHCCSHRIGRVIAARWDLDTAVIQLDAGMKYKPEIQDLGPIAGAVAPQSGIPVLKRGRTTQRTTAATGGTVRALNVTGVSGEMFRLYTNSFLIQSVTQDPFGAPGDSGSAIVNLSSQVVGIHWGGYDVWGFASPIDQIITAFPAYALNFAPVPAQGQAANAVRTVPGAQMSAVDAAAVGAPLIQGGRLQERMREAEAEITSTAAGKTYADLVRRHFEEAQRLINRNRRVATAWHRNGGPQLLQAFLQMIQHREQRVPKEFSGKPLAECLRRILHVMERYASPQLRADLNEHVPRLAGFAGLTYRDVLSMLQS
jgi:hypothetical protein